jgi:alkylhydroperoxidase family enzyme
MARVLAASPPFSETIQARLDTLGRGRPPLSLFTTLARDERLFNRFMNGALLDPGGLTLRQREIVIDRTCARCRSSYEWGVHVALFSGSAGLGPNELASLATGSAADACWEDSERALIEACDQLHATSTIDQACWTRLSDAYREEQIIEVIMLIGFYHTVSYLTNALALPDEDFAAGLSARLSS